MRIRPRPKNKPACWAGPHSAPRDIRVYRRGFSRPILRSDILHGSYPGQAGQSPASSHNTRTPSHARSDNISARGLCVKLFLAFYKKIFLGNTAQSAIGISWKICALISSLFLEVHKVHLRKSAFIRTQIFSGSALAELCGIALIFLHIEPVAASKRSSFVILRSRVTKELSFAVSGRFGGRILRLRLASLGMTALLYYCMEHPRSDDRGCFFG